MGEGSQKSAKKVSHIIWMAPKNCGKVKLGYDKHHGKKIVLYSRDWEHLWSKIFTNMNDILFIIAVHLWYNRNHYNQV